MLTHRPHIAVIGGGIAGLVSALRLLQNGSRVTLLEAERELGGRCGTFEHEGATIEKFPHVLHSGDTHLLQLLDELGLNDQILWKKKNRSAIFNGKRTFPFQTRFDMLTYRGLGAWSRLRLAMGFARAARLGDDPRQLHDVPTCDWLHRVFGRTVTSRLWKPLLHARFLGLCEDGPAYCFWSRMRPEDGASRQSAGYLNGGNQRLIESLTREIQRLGGIIQRATPVESIRDTADGVQIQVRGRWEFYDAAISALPLPVLASIARGQVEASLPARDLKFEGLVSTVVLLRQRLQSNFWTGILRKGYPFQSLVESTHVVPPSQAGGRHLVYLLNHCSTDSAAYARTDGDIRFQALKCLRDFNPSFQPDWVEDIRVFRMPYAQPKWPVGFKDQRPRMRVGNTRVYLATAAQSYPEPGTWNTMTGIAKDAADRVRFDFDNVYDREAAATTSAG